MRIPVLEARGVRELLYLSERKMRQFLPTLRSRWSLPKVTLTAPMASVAISPEADPEHARAKRLRKITKHVDRNAVWYTDGGVAAGQWMAFEARMNYLIPEDHPKCVLFVNISSTPPQRGDAVDTRLLLHGSVEHLLTGHAPAFVADLQAEGQQVEVREAGGGGTSDGASYAAYVRRYNTVGLLLRDTLEPLAHIPPTADGWRTAGTHGLGWQPLNLAAATSRLVRGVDRRLPSETAVWMSGYARVTAAFTHPQDQSDSGTRYVVGSPLFVQYAPQPPVDST
jgi:hypothetical protein